MGGGPIAQATQPDGGLAQLGERRVRNAEAEGSNPLPSTRSNRSPEIGVLAESHLRPFARAEATPNPFVRLRL